MKTWRNVTVTIVAAVSMMLITGCSSPRLCILQMSELRYLLMQFAGEHGKFPETLEDVDYSSINISRSQLQHLVYRAAGQKYQVEKPIVLFEEAQIHNRAPAWAPAGAGRFIFLNFYLPLWLPQDHNNSHTVRLLSSAPTISAILLNEITPNASDENGQTPLHVAVQAGRLDTVRLLLKAGANPNATDKLDDTPLFRSIIKSLTDDGVYEDIAAELIANGAEKDIYYAIWVGDTTAIKDIVHKNPDILNIQASLYTPLAFAGRTGNVNMVRLLLEYGAEVNVPDYRYQVQPVYVAAKHDRQEAVEVLIEAGAQPDLFAKAAMGKYDEIIEHVKTEDDLEESFYSHLLTEAIHHGRNELTVKLLQIPAIDSYQGLKNDFLRKAAEMGNTEIMEVLIASGAEIDNSSFLGTALKRAVWFDQRDAIKLLLSYGADANVGCSGGGETALHSATRLTAKGDRASAAIVEMLLEAGADVNAQTIHGLTPLHYALIFYNAHLIEALLEHGADPSISPKGGYNALQKALIHGHYKEYKMLKAIVNQKR